MGNIRIGYSDRGMMDRQDNLNLGRKALKKGLTAEQAKEYAKNRGGAEAIVREKNGTFSVYPLSTSEKGKEIWTKDFENGSIDITRDVAAATHSDKAYVMTSTNYLRTLDNTSIPLDHLDQNFATADLDLTLEDINGLDQQGKNDLKGTLNGQVRIDRAALEYGLAEGEKASGLDLELKSYSKDQYLKVNASYGVVGLGHLKIRPYKTGLKIDVGGLVGNLADAADWGGKKLGLNPQQAAENIVKKMAKGMGLKIASSDISSYTLVPDLENNPLLKEFAIGPGQKIKVEDIQVDPQKTSFQVKSGGDLVLNLSNAKISGSTQANGPQSVQDQEGSDQLKVKLKAELRNDLQVSAQVETDLDIKLKPNEAQGLQSQLKKMGVDAPAASGNISVSDIKVETTMKPNGPIQFEQTQQGQFAFQDLDLKVADTHLNLDVQGQIKGQQSGEKIILEGSDVGLSGVVSNPQGKLDLEKLNLDGKLTLDPAQPNQLDFDAQKGLEIEAKLKVNELGKTAHLKDLKVGPAQVSIDMAKGKLDFTGRRGQAAQISAKGLGLGQDLYVGDLKLKGSLKGDLNTGQLAIDAQDVSLWGTFDQAKLDYLKGSGQISYNPASGLKVTDAKIAMKGQIQDAQIERLSGQGDMSISPSGALRLDKGKNLDFQGVFPDVKIRVQGDFNLQSQGTVLKAQTRGKDATFNMDGPVSLKDLKVQGKTTLDLAKNDLRVEAQNDEPISLSGGKAGDLSFENVTAKNAEFQADLYKGDFRFKPLSGQTLEVSGSLNGVKIDSLKAQGPIDFKANQNKLSFEQPIEVSMKEYGLESLSTQGPIEFWNDAQGRLHLKAQGAEISGNYQGLNLDKMKLTGELIFDPKTQALDLEGLNNEPVKIQGKMNGFELDMSSAGQVTFTDRPEGLEIAGKGVKIGGLLDGFVLESGENTSGKVVVSRDGQEVNLKELDLNIAVEDVNLNAGQSLFKRTSEGYEINLSGELKLKDQQLYSLLDKIDSRKGLTQAVKTGLQTVETQLKGHVKGFDQLTTQYDDLKIKLGKDFSFKGIEGQQNSQFEGLKVAVNNKTFDLGQVSMNSELNITPEKTELPAGQIEFGFTPKLREQLADAIKDQMENSGFDDVQLTIGANGEVDVENATYKHKTKTKSLFGGKSKVKVRNIRTKLKLDVAVEGSHLKVHLDEFGLKNLIYDVISKVAFGKDKVGEMAEAQLRQQAFAVEYDKDKDVFDLDLNKTLQGMMPGDVALKSAELKDGRITIDYTVQ